MVIKAALKKKLQPHKHALLFYDYIQLGKKKKKKTEIHRWPLSLQVLSDWHRPGSSQRPLRLQQKCLNTYDNQK